LKAGVRDRYGPPSVVSVRDIDRPIPSDNEVLVRVHAGSVNRPDLDSLYPRWQLTRLFLGRRRPRIHGVGLDVAGVVDSVGRTVSRFRPGDKVFGDLYLFGQGAFAEYVCASEKAFAAIPTGLTCDEAATLPHSAVLALQGLRLRDGRTIGPGDRVLIVGASGNVGPFAVQIAKAMGADVTGVCRTDKVDFVRSLGADRVIDYTKVDYTRSGERYNVVVDVDAHHSFLRWRGVLGPKGVYVAMGGSSSWLLQALFVAPLISRASQKRMGLLLWCKPFNPADVATLKELIAAGKVKAVIDRRFRLSQVVDALRYVEEGRAKGKVIITA